MAERGTNRPAEVRGLTVDQLAEGARLLAEFKSDPTPRTFSAWAIWRTENGEALLQRVAEVEGCVWDIVRRLNEEADIDTAAIRKGFLVDLHNGRATAFQAAIGWIKSIAARHNIDPARRKEGKGEQAIQFQNWRPRYQEPGDLDRV